jgi:hypothetical protein
MAAGDIKFELSGTSKVTGASKLDYIGEPTMGNIEISGGSTLSKK